MGETPDQIERHIHEKRSELGENIHELQEKVKTTLDWRAQFEERPMLLLGLAFGGGVLASVIFGGKKLRRSKPSNRWKRESQRLDYASSARSDDWQDKADSTWNNIRTALLAVAGSRIGGLIEEVLPGFQEQFKNRQRERSSGEGRGSGSSRHNGPESAYRRTASGETDYTPTS